MFHHLSNRIMKYNKFFIPVLLFIFGALTIACDAEFKYTEEASPTVGSDVPVLGFASSNQTSFELNPAVTPLLYLTHVSKNGKESLYASIIIVDNTKKNIDVPTT